jgi:hypothetical protein
LDDGKTKGVIISLDIIDTENELVLKVRNQIENELKIKGPNVLINASHNHHTQDQLANDLIDRIVKAVKNANQSLVPVKIGAGKGYEYRITMNRRLKLKNGKEWTIRRATPIPPEEEVIDIGPFDPEIGILKIDRIDGKPLAVIYNFASHAYGGVPNLGVTADLPGFTSKVIEENLGNGAIALFLQGALGDITPILYKDVNAPRPTETFGNMLGLSTLRALKNITTKKEESIKIITENVILHTRTDVSERIDSLEAQKEIILKYFAGIGCGAHGAGTNLNFKSFLPLYIKYSLDSEFPSYYSYRYLQEKKINKDDLENLDSENKRNIQKYLGNIYNMEKLINIMTNLEIIKSLKEKINGDLTIEIQCIKIGDFVLITFPGEPFTQVGLDIKKLSPYKNTFLLGCTNGDIGYAPTTECFEGETYEDLGSQLSKEWQEIYEKKVLEIINKL